MKFKKKFVVAMIVPMIFWAYSYGDTAQEPAEKPQPGPTSKGFYYDAKTDRYFTDGSSSFSIRPSEQNNKFVDRIEVSIDDSPFGPYSGKVHFEKEGVHQIRFRAADPVLNWSPLQEFRVFVDMTPPSSSVTWLGFTFQGSSHLFVSPSSMLTVTSQDALSSVAHVRYEENGKTLEYNHHVQFKTDGEHRIRFAAIDNVGNQEAWKDIRFLVDSKPPTTRSEVTGLTYKTDKVTYVNSGAQVRLMATDEGSGVQFIKYQVNGAPQISYENPVAIVKKRTEIRYRSVDQVGNPEPWNVMLFLQDATPPALAVEKVGRFVASGGKIFATPGFEFAIKAKDEEAGVDRLLVTEQGKQQQNLAGEKHSFTQPGEYQVSFKAIDRVGNRSETEPYRVIIDSQPPKSEVQAMERIVPVDNLFVSGVPNKLEIISRDDGVGTDRIEYSFDGKSFTPYTHAIDLAQLSNPQLTLHFRATDRLGNKEATQTMNFLLRREGPKIDLFVESEKHPEVPLSVFKKGDLRQLEKRGPASTPGE